MSSLKGSRVHWPLGPTDWLSSPGGQQKSLTLTNQCPTHTGEACSPCVTSSFLSLVVWPGAPSSVLAPSSDARSPSSFLLLVAMPGAPSSFLFLVVWPEPLVASLLLVGMPGAPSSVLAPSSDARSAW